MKPPKAQRRLHRSCMLSTIGLLVVSVRECTVRSRQRGGAWRRIGFQRLWGASTVWALGAEVTELALPTLAILGFAASPAEAGLLIAAPWLTFLVVGLPAGALVDRLPRRHVIVFADLGRFAALVSVPAAFALGRLSLPWLYAAAFASGLLGVF